VIESATAGSTDQHAARLLGDRQHGERHRRAGGADREIGVVVVVAFLEQGAPAVGAELVVLDDDVDAPAADLHRALGQELEAHHEADLGLARIGFQRPGAAGDQANANSCCAKPGRPKARG